MHYDAFLAVDHYFGQFMVYILLLLTQLQRGAAWFAHNCDFPPAA